MAGESVGWADYENIANAGGLFVDGADLVGGESSVGDVDALNKALAAGSSIDNPGASAGEGFPLRTESLDAALVVTTYKANEAKFWQMLYKDAAYNTVEEYNRLEAYGSGDAAFIGEGDLPSEDDSTYSRNYVRIKFMGTTRRVTHVMSLLRTAHGPAVAREVNNGTLWLIRQLERKLFVGDESLVPIEFDGLEKLMITAFGATRSEDDQFLGYEDTTNVFDLRGAPLSEDHITDLTEKLQSEPNFGTPSDLWMPPSITKDLSKILYPKERYDIPAPSGGKAGIAINGIKTPFGDINFDVDKFIPQSDLASDDGVGKAGIRPTPPTVGTPTSPAYAGVNATFFDGDWAGTYIYKVVAGSRYGRSAPATSSAIAVAAADQVSLPVSDNGPSTTYYEVYRTAAGGAAATARSIMRVRRTGVSQTIVDLNRFLPGCNKAYMLTQSNEVLKWKQLAPFTKINLATIDTSIRWMQVLYGALQFMQPRKCGMFINVGPLATGMNA